MHFGWNIGKAFGKKRIHTATFIKNVFAYALRDIEVSTIERKMSHTESECRIKLDGEYSVIFYWLYALFARFSHNRIVARPYNTVIYYNILKPNFSPNPA